MEAGADDFLSKPFDHRVLKVRIAAGSRIVRLEQTLNQLASRDALTQCWNRRMIDELFTNSIAESTRKRSAFSIMVLDIDHFKAVNDTYGHAAGDVALKHVVSILNTNLREYDQVGRYGGEEFVILLPSTDVNEAWGVAERVRSAIQFQPTVLNDDTKVDMTVSIGIAQFNRSRDINQNAFFERADKALYTAKQSGRNRIICAD
jgi:diguanylate cyclase (GGDEF)-like protein